MPPKKQRFHLTEPGSDTPPSPEHWSTCSTATDVARQSAHGLAATAWRPATRERICRSYEQYQRPRKPPWIPMVCEKPTLFQVFRRHFNHQQMVAKPRVTPCVHHVVSTPFCSMLTKRPTCSRLVWVVDSSIMFNPCAFGAN